LLAARHEIARLSEALKEMAVNVTLPTTRCWSAAGSACCSLEEKRALGVMGPVHRSARTGQDGLLELVDHAVEEGWPTTCACAVLDRSRTTTTNVITEQ
jgi:hypothetical protein